LGVGRNVFLDGVPVLDARGLILVNIQRLRSETPGCEERIHLNNAGSALMPEPVIRAIQDHITLESRIGGYEAADARRDAVQGAYQSVAELVGTQPENIAFTENATASYMQALSSIPFERDDVILTTRNDYVSNQIQFLSLRARMGVQVLRAPDRIEGGVDVQAMADLIAAESPARACPRKRWRSTSRNDWKKDCARPAIKWS